MELKYKISYPNNSDYEYETYLERINIDDEFMADMTNNNGFIISEPKSIKKDIKDPNGIFSNKYGPGLQDVNACTDKYKCECGSTNGRINNATKCPICKTFVKYVDDNFSYFGWIKLKEPYYIIHPNLYKTISSIIGDKRLVDILTIKDDKDKEGKSIFMERKSSDPFSGIGIIEFKNRFKEIIKFYADKNSKKELFYEDILENMDNIFISNIPVFTTHLRPFRIEDNSLFFEGTNAIYNMMVKLVYTINKDNLSMSKKSKPKNQLLFDLQIKYIALYKELEKIMSGKKGSIRTLFGGRYNFTGRAVIGLDPKLRIDQVRLPYRLLCELLQQSIINILQKSHNISYNDAYLYWYRASMKSNDTTISSIITSIINNSSEGIPIIINRNPTIAYGGILQMFCIGINYNYTMSIPPGIIIGLAADFDGDALNILYIINKDFFKVANHVLNPRNNMYISKNDGYVNNNTLPMKDTLINANSLISISRDKYTEYELQKIEEMKRG